MRYEIVLAPQAVEDLRLLKANVRPVVRSSIESHLRHEPTRTTRSAVKRLRGRTKPQYRLRVGHMRVFYDVVEERVEILAVMDKSQAAAWLERLGEFHEESTTE